MGFYEIKAESKTAFEGKLSDKMDKTIVVEVEQTCILNFVRFERQNLIKCMMNKPGKRVMVRFYQYRPLAKNKTHVPKL
jgi:ribosomal protein S17